LWDPGGKANPGYREDGGKSSCAVEGRETRKLSPVVLGTVAGRLGRGDKVEDVRVREAKWLSGRLRCRRKRILRNTIPITRRIATVAKTNSSAVLDRPLIPLDSVVLEVGVGVVVGTVKKSDVDCEDVDCDVTEPEDVREAEEEETEGPLDEEDI
jgi:hypothetical protein